MTAHERGVKATEFIRESGIECIIDSAVPDTITVLCGSGVMAYHEGKLLMLGEHVALTESPVPLFINDVANHRHTTVMV